MDSKDRRKKQHLRVCDPLDCESDDSYLSDSESVEEFLTNLQHAESDTDSDDTQLTSRTEVAEGLSKSGRDAAKKKGPSSTVEREYQQKKRRGPTKAIPAPEIRMDRIGHWPVVENSRQRCKKPNCKGHTVFKCSKCNVHLCLNKNSNCFKDFHE